MAAIAFLDFESSILAREGWPTEVAYIGADGRWSSLIKPLDHWTAWDPEMEAMTGIHQADLAQGAAPADVCAQLEAGLADKLVYVTHPYDAKWLRTLFSHALGRNERIVAANVYSLWGVDGNAAYAAYLAQAPLKQKRALNEAEATWAFYQKVWLPGQKASNGGDAGWNAFQPPSPAK